MGNRNRTTQMNDDTGEPESTGPVLPPDPNAEALAKFYEAEAAKARTKLKRLQSQLDTAIKNATDRSTERKVKFLQGLADGILERLEDEDAKKVRKARLN